MNQCWLLSPRPVILGHHHLGQWTPHHLTTNQNLCQNSNANIYLKILDVKDEIASQNYITEIEENFALDLVIANAGISGGTAQGTESFAQVKEIFDTNLEDATEAAAVAARRLQLKAYPRAFFDSIEFPLGSPEIDDTDRDDLLNIFMGLPLEITDLPNNIVNTTFQGYVEGWTFRSSYNALSITINASPIEFSQVTLRWNQVSALESWNTINPTLTWENAIGSVA